jgi:hypothetical protein
MADWKDDLADAVSNKFTKEQQDTEASNNKQRFIKGARAGDLGWYSDLPPIISPRIMRLSPVFVRPAHLSP